MHERACDGNLESATNFKQRDNVVYRNAFENEPKSGRRNVNRPLSWSKRIGLIVAERSQLAGKLGGIFAAVSHAEPMPNRARNGCGSRYPFAAVVSWMEGGHRRLEYRAGSHRNSKWNRRDIQKAPVTGYAGSYLQLRNPGTRSTRLQWLTSGIAAEASGKQFWGAFLLFEGKAVDSPEDLVFTEQYREDCIRRGNRVRGRSERESGLSIDI